MSEEIDLRPYIQLLVRRWRWIAGGTFVAILAALVSSYLSPKVYQAEAIVTVVRSRTDVTFDSRIRTVLEDELAIPGDSAGTRHEGLIALVTSNDIARQVLAEAGSDLPPSERSVAALQQIVSATGRGNLIIITVRHADPDVAAQIANQWAQVYERRVNELYGTNRGDNVEVVAQQARAAQEAYEAAQDEVEKFIADNRIASLQHEISVQQALLDSYQSARTTIQTTPIDLEINNSSQMLANHFQDLQQVESWLTAARALQDQVVSDTGSTTANLGNMLALVFLRGQVFGGIGSVQLQIDLNADAVEPVQPADVDALIDVLEARRQATQAQIDALLPRLVSTELTELTLEPDHPLNARIAGLTTDLLMFHSELEAQTMRQRELEQTRDLAWETYQVLVEKQVEEEIAARTPGTEVRLASSAVPPDQPVSAPLRSNVMVAGALGLMLSIFVVFVENWWSGEMAQPQWQPATYANSSYTSRPTVRYPPGDELKSAQPLVEDGDPGQPTSNR